MNLGCFVNKHKLQNITNLIGGDLMIDKILPCIGHFLIFLGILLSIIIQY